MPTWCSYQQGAHKHWTTTSAITINIFLAKVRRVLRTCAHLVRLSAVSTDTHWPCDPLLHLSCIVWRMCWNSGAVKTSPLSSKHSTLKRRPLYVTITLDGVSPSDSDASNSRIGGFKNVFTDSELTKCMLQSSVYKLVNSDDVHKEMYNSVYAVSSTYRIPSH